MRSNVLIALITTAMACGGTAKDEPIENAQMEESAKSIGPTSNAVASMSADAESSTVEANVQALGTSFGSLVSQHQAYAATSARIAVPLRSTALTSPHDLLMPITLIDDAASLTWDGEHLSGSYVFNDEDHGDFAYTYQVDMTFAAGSDGGYVIDGTYDFDWDLTSYNTSYEIHAKYVGLTVDGDGCATAGTLDITYDYNIAGLQDIPGVSSTGNYSGHVKASFAGCDIVTLTGSN